MNEVMKLEELQQIDIRTVKKSELVDIKNININPKHSKKERMREYLEQVKNPFCFLSNGIIVKTNFNPNGESLEALLSDYFTALGG